MGRAGGLVLVATSLVACGPSYSKLKVDDIQTVAVVVDDPQQRFCAYQPVPLRAIVTYRNGNQARTRAVGENQRGLLRTSEFAWSSSHGAIDPEIVLSLPRDPLAWFDEPITVGARVIERAELGGETTLRPRFDCGGTLDLRGAEGARGGESEHGGPGEAGPEVEVALAYVDSTRSGRLVLVRVQRGGEQPEHFLVDPQGDRSPLVIDARGGAGGRGGQGVPGYDGRPGEDGENGADDVECGYTTAGQAGTDGQPGGPGGPGADGGPGGAGGNVVVRYDARFPELRQLIQIRVEGGAAGAAGPGGAGGRGGKGGAGGAGGRGGADAAGGAETAADCNAPDGARGADGASGGAGPQGVPGVAGPAGNVSVSAAEVRELFAEELAREIPIVTE